MADRRLLAVLAHPDDESFGPGGTLAKYADQGAAVHVAICTDGAAGSVTAEFEEARERLAEIRCAELEAAVEILGVQLHTLGFRDSGYIGDPANEDPQAFMNVVAEEATARVVALMRSIRPQVVITHDETGGYFHPDHIKAHEITLAAFHAAGDGGQYEQLGAPYAPQALYYTAIPRRWLTVYRAIIRLRGQDPRRMGRNQDIDFTKLGRPMAELHARINTYAYWQTKLEASAQHRSQGGGGGSSWASWLPRRAQRRLFSTEYFIRAQPPAHNGQRIYDLFEGIELRANTER